MMRKITIQVSDPPELQISPEIKSIVILNHSINTRFSDLPRDSAEDLPFTLRKNDFFDTAASDSAILSAARAIYDSQRFDVVVPTDHTIFRNDNAEIAEPLDARFIKEICEEFGVDAALVLESFSEKVSGNFVIPWMRPLGTIEMKSKLIWRFYQPGKKELSLLTGENLFWYGGLDNSRKEGYRQLPPLKEILSEGASISGWSVAAKIGPDWRNDQRVYYKTGKKKIDSAIPLIKAGQWKEASEIWLNSLDSAHSYLKHRIEFNLAVASELEGDIESAIDWVKKSQALQASRQKSHYLKYLIKRQKVLNKEKT